MDTPRQGAAYPSMISGIGTQGKLHRLVGWKVIGQFLGCTARTARRWEESRGLPVHRVPGGGRSAVWASPDELTAWLRSQSDTAPVDILTEAAAPITPYSASSPFRSLRTYDAAVVVLLVLIGVAWRFVDWAPHEAAQPKPAAYEDDPRASALYASARFKVAARSAESLAAAEKDYLQLTAQFPDRAAGWSGLADTYLLVREFGAMPEAQAYARAEAAANKAVALDPQSADAWLDIGFIAFWWKGETAASSRAFDTALKLDPHSAKAFHWYATAQFGAGNFDKSLDLIARARALDPASRAIAADQGWILFCAGRRDEGLSELESLVRIEPQFVLWHKYLARAYLVMSRDQDFLREAITTAELRGQTDAAAELRRVQSEYRAGGTRAMLDRLSANEAAAWQRGEGSATMVAAYRALALDRPGLLKWLTIADAGKDTNLTMVNNAPEFANYRTEPELKAVQARLH